MKVKILVLTVMLPGLLVCEGFSTTSDLFFDKASHFHLIEIRAGKLAEIKGNPEVVKLGKELVKYHTIAKNELYVLAGKQGVKISALPRSAQEKILSDLKELSGKAFDSAYMVSQFRRYKQAIVFFAEESKNGINPEARAYAGKYLPKLQMHLQMFEGNRAAMKTSMDSAGKK